MHLPEGVFYYTKGVNMNYTVLNGQVLNLKTGKILKGSKNEKGYIKVCLGGKYKKAHRLIWEHYNGPILKGMVIHHINGLRDDNRIENLSMISQADNVKKRMGLGCSMDKRDGRWRAYRLNKHYGSFGTKCGAMMASRMAFINN